MKLQDLDTGDVYTAEPGHEPDTMVLRNGPGGLFRPRHPFAGGNRPRAPHQPLVVRPRPQPQPPTVANQSGPLIHDSGEYLTIKKSAFAELLPAIGKAWASILARPEPPAATGDHITDRDNASMHRDSLAMHQQNQTRILALTDLAARAAKLLF